MIACTLLENFYGLKDWKQWTKNWIHSSSQTDNSKKVSRQQYPKLTTNVTTVSTESITKLSNDLSALLPAINKVAHGLAPKISSVKDAVEKMSSTYATATNKGAAIQTETCTITTKPRDVNGVLIIENADPTFRNSSDIKEASPKPSPKRNYYMPSEPPEGISTWNLKHTMNPKRLKMHGGQTSWVRTRSVAGQERFRKTSQS